MHRILVPVDGSPGSERAVEHVVRLARNTDEAEVHLLHVDAPVATRGVNPAVLSGLVSRVQREEEERTTRPAEDRLHEAGVRHVCRIETGDVAQTIVRYARTHACDEIVMGTRGKGTIRSLVLGSVAAEVVYLVDIPVTLVK